MKVIGIGIDGKNEGSFYKDHYLWFNIMNQKV